MGCCNSKTNDFDSNDLLIFNLEQNLNIGKIPFDQLSLAIDMHSVQNQMNPKQFSSFCDAVQMKKNSKESLLLTQFRSDSGLISALKVKAASVLLSTVVREEKIKNYFSIYDIKKLGRLNHDEINSMITDLFEISVQDIIKFASIFIQKVTSETLSEYYISMSKVKNIIIFYLFQRFTDGVEFLTLPCFEKCFKSVEMDVLISSRLIRKFSYSMYLSNKTKNISSDEQTGHVTKLDRSARRRITRKLSKVYE